VPPGVFSARVAYFQDDDGGIRLYLPQDHRMWCEPGERFEITGHTGSYYDELQLRVEDRQDVRRLGPADPPAGLPITSGQLSEPYEGTLVTLNGTVVEVESIRAFWLDDGTRASRVYTDPDAPLSAPALQIGQPVAVTGVVSQYRGDEPVRNAGYRLLPRYTSDLVAGSALAPLLVPQRLPETGSRPE
jgi:DNA/RNA endonuclease YhcR with UshA esterase domain